MADKDPEPLITGKQLELLKKAVEIEQTDAKAVGTVGYQTRLWAQVSLPYRNPGDAPYWERRNGSMSLVVRPSLIRGTDGSLVQEYPYGVIPRLLLTWMATEVVRIGEPELALGPSLASFMRSVGLQPRGGKDVKAFNRQVQRLAKCTITVEDSRENSLVGENFQFVDAWDLWWTPKDGPNEMLWPSTITLSDKYYQSIKAAPIPVDLRALGALRTHGGGGLPIDVYTWLAHRMSYLRSSTLVPWNLLMVQFGSQYTRERAFKTELLKALAKVKLVYSLVKVTPTDDGLLLSPSPTPISARR
ncbi:MAG: replication protein RepA [Candidatus Nanopelagicales bacterium]|jgi:hypothetical protein